MVTGLPALQAFLQLLTDLPVVAEWVHHSPQPPSVLVLDRPDNRRSGTDRLFECSVWIFHHHHHTNGSAAQSLGTEVLVVRRFVGDPELGSVHRQPADDRAT